MTNPAPSTTTWSWHPTLSAGLQRKVVLGFVGVAVATLVSLGIAVATPGRFVVVITVLLVGIAVLWTLEHRRFRATTVSVDDSGRLTVTDGRSTSSIDLTTVDSVAVRLRTQPGVSVLASTPRWTIELAGPGSVLNHPIAHAGGLCNPDRADVEALEAGLLDLVGRVSGTTRPTMPIDASVPHAGTSPSLGDSVGRFEWTPPVSANASKRRRWYRIAYGGAAALIAVLGVVSAWGDWVGVVLSAVTVPGLLLLFCGGIDWVLGRSRRFRLWVDHDVLHVQPGSTARQIQLRGATVDIDRTSHLTSTATTTTRSTIWILTVTAADGSQLKQAMPGLGTTTTESDYRALEHELRRRT